jgi:hypothetical protein
VLGRVTAALAGAATLAGCSLGGDEEPRPISGQAKRVAQVIEELERAARRQDFAAICDDLLSTAARRRAGGRDCAKLLQDSAGEVRRPSIRLIAIELTRDGARATVRTRARGQTAVEDTLVLVREGRDYRIESLAG